MFFVRVAGWLAREGDHLAWISWAAVGGNDGDALVVMPTGLVHFEPHCSKTTPFDSFATCIEDALPFQSTRS